MHLIYHHTKASFYTSNLLYNKIVGLDHFSATFDIKLKFNTTVELKDDAVDKDKRVNKIKQRNRYDFKLIDSICPPFWME
jgi:hypothetical protein